MPEMENKYAKTRRFKYGINAVILMISVFGIIFVLNAIVLRYTKQFDFTENKRFTLTPQTLNLLKNLKKEVKIYIFSKEDDAENELLKDLLNQYSRTTKFIKVEHVDIDKNPSKAEKYNIRNYGIIIFECEKSKSQITQNELFDFGLGMFGHGEEAPKFNGEQVLTSNIMKVASEGKKTIYFLIGHGERLVSNMEDNGYYKIQDYIVKENYEIKSVNLSTEPEIPVKDSILVVAGPKYNLLEREENVINDYLGKGGKALFLIDPQMAKGIDRLLRKWSVDAIDNIVIDSGRSYFYDPLTPVPDYVSHSITEDLIRTKTGAVFPGTRSIIKSSKPREDLDIRALLETSDKSWAEKNLTSSKVQFDSDEDIKGPITIALAIEKKKPQNTDTTGVDTAKAEVSKPGSLETRIIVIGDSDFVSNRMSVIQGNIDFFMNSLNWLAGEIDKIAIRPKVLDIKRIQMTKNQSKSVVFVTIAGIPLLVIIIGGIIWWKRRSL